MRETLLIKDKSRQQQLLHDRGICIVIPTYNNGGTIANVVHDVLQECIDVIVVNDGSTDNTSDTLHSIEGITIVECNRNKGKGAALRYGFERALEMGFSYAITIDGDGQHYARDIEKFLEANQQTPGALIVGNRRLEGVDRSKGSTFANKFSNFWFYIQTGKKLQDTQTGYRLYPLRKLKGLQFLTSRYEAELELLVFSSWHGVKLIPIDIEVYYPPREKRVSHFRPVADFARISVLNTVLCFLAILYGLPLRLCRFIMKYLRTIYSLLFFIFFSLFVISPATWLYVHIGRMTEKKRINLHKLIQWCAKFVMIKHGIPGVKFKYEVEEGVRFDKPYVVICNHQSHLDLMCQLIFTPQIIFLTNDWVWNSLFYGFLIRNAEYYPISEGIDFLLPKLKSFVERGYSIAVYPEGTRSKNCKIGRFHQGAFYLAEKLGVDVLPMYLYGPGKVLPKRSYYLRKSPIYIRVEKAISNSELANLGDTKRQASIFRKRYVEKYEKISNSIERNV